MALLYALFFSAYTVQRHDAFLTSAFDLGNFDQTLWNTAHGRPFAISNIPGVRIRLAHHVEPILLLIAPLYWLWPDVRAILVLQSVMIGAGAVPLFWYAARQVGEGPALLCAAIYLLFPALQGVNLFDFHAVALAPFFLLLAWNWLDERRDGPFLAAGLLAAATKEEIGLLVAMMGLYALLVQRRRFGWLPLLAGAGWFLVVLEVITPTFNQAGQHEFMGFYSRWGTSGPDVARYLLTHPLEVARWLSQPTQARYLRDLLTPTLGVSLLAPQVLLVAAPSLAVNLLSASPFMTTLEGFHYPAAIVPFVVAAGAAGVRRLADWGARLGRWEGEGAGKRRAAMAWGGALAMLLATLLYHRGQGMTPLAREWRWPVVTDHHRVGAALLATIPPDAAVAAQSQINPHLSQREQIYRFPGDQEGRFVVVDVTVPDLMMHPNDLRADMEGRLASGKWGIHAARDGWLVLVRCEAGKPCQRTLPDEFFSYARAVNPAPQYRADARFGDALRLHGYDVALLPEGARVRLYWEALRPITEPLRPWLLFWQAPNSVLEDTSQRPLMETVWYPPRRWKVGEIVTTTTLPYLRAADWELLLSVRASEQGAALLPLTSGQGAAVPDLARARAGSLKLLTVQGGRVLPESLRRFALPVGMRPSNALLEDGIALAGVSFPPRVAAGEALTVTLGWQAGESVPAADYSAFVQLLGPGGLITQSDSYPTSFLAGVPLERPTTGWAEGEVLLDQHVLVLSPALPPGEYQLIAGLYDLARGGARLPATVDGVALPDAAIPLGTVTVQGQE